MTRQLPPNYIDPNHNYMKGDQEWCCRMKLMVPRDNNLRLLISTQPFKSEVVRGERFSYVLTSSSDSVLNSCDFTIFRGAIKLHTGMDPYIFNS